MTRFVATITLIFFSVYVQNAAVIWSCYFTFAKTIAEEYCVNKQSKTIPKCNGKCHVSKAIDEKPKDESAKVEIRLPEVSEFFTEAIVLPNLKSTDIVSSRFFLKADLSKGYSQQVFSPPKNSI